MPITISTLIASQRAVREFTLFHQTALRWGDYHFLVYSTPSLFNEVNGYSRVTTIPNIHESLSFADGERRDFHDTKAKDLMKYKMAVSREAIYRHGHVLYMDADMMIVSEFDFSILPKDDQEVVGTLHYTRIEKYPVYAAWNAGMFSTANLDFINAWEKEIVMDPTDFADQSAFNRMASRQGIRFREMGKGYNVGWNRFSGDDFYKPTIPLIYEKGRFYFDGELVFNFHLHLEPCAYTSDGFTQLRWEISQLVDDVHPEIKKAVHCK